MVELLCGRVDGAHAADVAGSWCVQISFLLMFFLGQIGLTV